MRVTHTGQGGLEGEVGVRVEEAWSHVAPHSIRLWNVILGVWEQVDGSGFVLLM